MALELLQRIDPDHGPVRDNSNYWALLSSVYHMLGQYERQIEVAREVSRRFPGDGRAVGYRARALAALGRLDELDAALNEALLLPTSPQRGAAGLFFHVYMSDELRAHGHAAHATKILERAIHFYEQSTPELQSNPRQRYHMARAYYRLGRLDLARAIFQELSRDPARYDVDVYTDSRVHLGHIAALTGDRETLTQVDTWLRELQPPFLFGWNSDSRAGMHALRGERDEAIRLLHQAASEGRPFDSGKHATFEYGNLRGYRPFEQWLKAKG